MVKLDPARFDRIRDTIVPDAVEAFVRYYVGQIAVVNQGILRAQRHHVSGILVFLPALPVIDSGVAAFLRANFHVDWQERIQLALDQPRPHLLERVFQKRLFFLLHSTEEVYVAPQRAFHGVAVDFHVAAIRSARRGIGSEIGYDVLALKLDVLGRVSAVLVQDSAKRSFAEITHLHQMLAFVAIDVDDVIALGDFNCACHGSYPSEVSVPSCPLIAWYQAPPRALAP